MSQGYRKVRIFIASPGDVTAERDRLRKVIEELDRMLGDELEVFLRTLDWRDIPPEMGRPQQVIFNQLSPETWDIFVGILWHRFGTPPGASNLATGEPFSAGTEEEFTQAYQLWKVRGRPRILIYRSARAVRPDKLDPEQFGKVDAFFKAFSADGAHPGLVKSFKSTTDFERNVRQDLGNILREMFGSAANREPHNLTPSATVGGAPQAVSATPPEPPSTAPIAASTGAANAEERAARLEELRELIKNKRERLFERQRQEALYGISADPAITIEIKRLKKEIDDLKLEAQKLEGS
jgi:hypothetical protein